MLNKTQLFTLLTLSTLLHGYVPQSCFRHMICNLTVFKGLACISHRSKLGLGTFTLYEHDSAGGEGVDVYIIDTGINI